MKKTALDLICTPAEAASMIGVSQERVLQFCRDGRLQARKMGRDWVILLDAAERFAKEPRENGLHLGK